MPIFVMGWLSCIIIIAMASHILALMSCTGYFDGKGVLQEDLNPSCDDSHYIHISKSGHCAGKVSSNSSSTCGLLHAPADDCLLFPPSSETCMDTATPSVCNETRLVDANCEGRSNCTVPKKKINSRWMTPTLAHNKSSSFLLLYECLKHLVHVTTSSDVNAADGATGKMSSVAQVNITCGESTINITDMAFADSSSKKLIRFCNDTCVQGSNHARCLLIASCQSQRSCNVSVRAPDAKDVPCIPNFKGGIPIVLQYTCIPISYLEGFKSHPDLPGGGKISAQSSDVITGIIVVVVVLTASAGVVVILLIYRRLRARKNATALKESVASPGFEEFRQSLDHDEQLLPMLSSAVANTLLPVTVPTNYEIIVLQSVGKLDLELVDNDLYEPSG